MLQHTLRRSSVTSLGVTSLGVIVLAATMALSGAVRAEPSEDDPEVVAQAKEHYKAGLGAYQAGHYDVAIRELKKAYLLKRLPPLLLNIGATYRKMGDVDLSLHFYQKFLDEAPAEARERADVEQIIAELKTQKTATESEAPKVVEEAPRGKVEWNHNVIDAAPPETPIDVRVTSPTMKGVKVYVFFRGSGQADYNSVLMKRKGQEKVGRIPAEAVSGRSLQYYIEAKDGSGNVVKSNGNAGNPNIIMIEEGVKPVLFVAANRRNDDDAEERSDEESAKKRRANADLDDEAAPITGHVSNTPDSDAWQRKKKSAKVGLTVLQIVGISSLSVGVGFAAIGGGLLGAAHSNATALSTDSKNPIDANNNKIFYNNDPNAGGTQEANLASRGHAESVAGGVFLGLGIAAAVNGAACLIVATVAKDKIDRAPEPKKKSTKKKHVESEEESSWYVAPGVGLKGANLAAGFSF